MADTNRYLVTGAMGCIGAWTLHHLVKTGKQAVSFDLSTNRSRLDLLLDTDEQAAITFIEGDLTDTDCVAASIQDHGITHVIHLAALQVPFCRANPVMGARVNVVGTVNVFEAAIKSNIEHIAYASSIAVYGPPSEYPAGLVAHDAPVLPSTLYGVYKVADEGLAKVYFQDHGLSSTALRPYTVYGVARDQGMTSEPTKALLNIAVGQPANISFNSPMQFQLASDVAKQFILAAEQPLNGAPVFNLGGSVLTSRDFADMVLRLRPDAEIVVGDTMLPFPEGFDDSALRESADKVFETSLKDGIEATLQHFELLLSAGKLSV